MSTTLRPFLLLLVLAFATPARAQFRPPSRVDDIDVSPPVKKASPPEPQGLPDDPPVVDESGEETYVPGRKRVPPPEPEPEPEKAREPNRTAEPERAAKPGRDAGTSDAAAGAVPTLGPDKTIKPILPPPAEGDAQLAAAWAERQRAGLTRNARDLEDAEKRILRLREELGYSNLFAMAAAASFDAEALRKSDGPEAVRRAMFAASLAPDLPSAHWTVARCAFSEDVTNVGRYVGSVVDALRATWREPRWRSAMGLGSGAALLGAFLLAGAALVVLVFLRHVRYFLHDFHHLFPAGAWPFQTALIAVLLLLVPLVFQLGPLSALGSLALVTWLQTSRAEKIVVGLYFALAGASPLAVGQLERWTSFTDTDAEAIYLVERGGPEAPVARVRGLVERSPSAFEAAFALGRRARLQGDYPGALPLLRQAAQLRPNSDEAMLELGTALFLSGDLDGARETYQRLLPRMPDSSALHYALARLFDRRAQAAAREDAPPLLVEAQSHGRRTIELDSVLGARIAGEVDLRANLFLPTVSLPVSELVLRAGLEAPPGGAAEDLSARLHPLLPRSLGWLGGFALTGMLALFGLLSGVLVPSGPCAKCGRPVCRRCDADVVGPALCGQCVSVFAQRGAVDSSARAAKEAGIKRYQRVRKWLIRVGAGLVPGGGAVLLGRPGRGLLALVLAALGGWGLAFRDGLVPAPWGELPMALRVVPAGLLLALVWALSLRRTLVETASFDLLKVAAPRAPEGAASKPAPPADGRPTEVEL